MQSVQGKISDVVFVEITAESFADDVTGFSLRVAVTDDSVARIASVELPGYGLQATGPLPADSVDISAADLNDLLDGSPTVVVIATLELELLAQGATDLALDLLVMDDGDGLDMVERVSLVNGTVSVTGP